MEAALKRLVLASGLMVLGGCCHKLVYIEPPVLCPIAQEQLAQTCASPSTIPDNATYGDLVGSHLVDRQSLKACKDHDEFLKQQIDTCNAQIRKYAARIDEINREYQLKRP